MQNVTKSLHCILQKYHCVHTVLTKYSWYGACTEWSVPNTPIATLLEKIDFCFARWYHL